jgi:glycosyltransferase involved in cell wall biosynthesis
MIVVRLCLLVLLFHAIEGWSQSVQVDNPINHDPALSTYFDHVQVVWYAPFLSGGGYSSEAMAFAGVFDKLDSVTSIEVRRKLQERSSSISTKGTVSNDEDPVWKEDSEYSQATDIEAIPFSVSFNMVHHGDSPSQTHIDGFTAGERALFESHFNLPKQTPGSGGLNGYTVYHEGNPGANNGLSDDAQNADSDTIILGGGKNRPKRILQIVVCHSEPGAWHAPTPRYHTQRCPPEEHDHSSQQYERDVRHLGRRGGGKSRTNSGGIEFSQFRIGRTMFETDRLPSGWPDRLRYMHEVWVPTNFSYGIFADAMGDSRHRLAVVEEPVDTDFFRPIDYADVARNRQEGVLGRLPSTLKALEAHISAKSTIFLFVGKWEERKGVRMLIRAFYRALATEDRADGTGKPAAVLVVLTAAYHSTNKFDKEIQKILKEEGLAAKAALRSAQYVLLTDVPQEHMPHLYSAATALVIPSTGEGWGRPHVEAMACGTPVIATAWSGPTAYLTEENGYPLRVAGMQAATGWDGHRWALPDEEHLRALLTEVHADHSAGSDDSSLRKKGRQARTDMISRFSFDAFSRVLARELRRIEKLAATEAVLRLAKEGEAIQGEDFEEEL